MEVKVKLDGTAILPKKAHKYDAGFDLFSKEDKIVKAKSSAIFDTGVHIEIPKHMVGFLKSKSGLNVKKSIVSEGVIDSGYTGSIIVKLYNNSDEDYYVFYGDKITQIVLIPIPDIDLIQVDTLDESERGNNGFGSSGR